MKEENKPENPYAFPNTDPTYFGANDSHGMTLRDYFAAKAMQATLSDIACETWSLDRHAEQAYKMSDAMLNQRNQ